MKQIESNIGVKTEHDFNPDFRKKTRNCALNPKHQEGLNFRDDHIYRTNTEIMLE